jgi:voltage-gated potassium channel
MATVGYGDIVAHTIMERWYSIGVMILGVGTFGYIIGNIATILANIDRIGSAHRAKLDQIRTHMRYHSFPRPLQQRVEEYYHYMFDHRLGYDDESFMKELPTSLRAEVCVFLHRDILRKVPFLQNAEPKVMERLAFRLKPSLFRPNDIIFRRGDSGDRMYFINRGCVEILSSDDVSIVASLQEGSFFGEMALLNLEARNATVRAQGFCELVCLEHSALEEVMRRFPNFAQEIRRVANERKQT